MRRSSVGFIRMNTGNQRGPPVIMSLKRRVLPGKMSKHLEAWRNLCDYEKLNCSGFIAKTMSRDVKDTNLTHTLIAYANIEAFEDWIRHAGVKGSMHKMLRKAYTETCDRTKPWIGKVWSASGARIDAIASVGHAKWTYYDYPVTG